MTAEPTSAPTPDSLSAPVAASSSTAAPVGSVPEPVHPLIERHQATLERAVLALTARDYWSVHPESPRAYGEPVALDALQGRTLLMDQPGTDGQVGPGPEQGGERSPYGPELGVGYPHASDPEALIAAATAARPDWAQAGPLVRAAVCCEIVARINARSPEFGAAVMHTTGQAPGMAFQAGGPHAQDRALEAVAQSYAEQTRLPGRAGWTKPQGKRDPLRMVLEFTPVPVGVALLVGCNTFPTWNGYPGLFASLATGNPVLVKPHPRAVLPLALTVDIAREVLAEAGFSADLVLLAAEQPGEWLAKTLALHPAVRIVDYTGSTGFGEWLEANAQQALVFTEKAGVNTVLIDSTDDYAGMLANLAFSLSLYSGQMCTTPQNLLVPRDGIETDQGHKSHSELVADLAGAVGALLGDDTRAAALLGAIVNPGVLERVEQAAKGEYGEVVLAPRPVPVAGFPDAVVRTPALVSLSLSRAEGAGRDGSTGAGGSVGGDGSLGGELPGECFGPVAFVVAVDSSAHAVELLRDTVRARGAMTASAYTTAPAVERAVVGACLDGGVSLSLNLTGQVYVNQTAAFADLHGTGANPAANSAYCDAAFVASRFRVVEVRRHG